MSHAKLPVSLALACAVALGCGGSTSDGSSSGTPGSGGGTLQGTTAEWNSTAGSVGLPDPAKVATASGPQGFDTTVYPSPEYRVLDAYAIKADRTLWQVLGSEQGPVQLGTDFVALFQGSANGWSSVAYALKLDGSVWSLQHLVDPNNHWLPFTTSTLTRIGTDSGFVRVVAGDSGVWAIKADGIPVRIDSSVAGYLPELGVIADIANPGSDGYAAVKPDKTLWVQSSRLGDGCVASQVPGNTYHAFPYQAGQGIAAVSAITPFNFAVVKTDGTLWTFGSGVLLGVGFMHPDAICKAAKIGTDYRSVHLGVGSLALKQDGTLMAWGWNYVSVAQPNPADLPTWNLSEPVLSPTSVSTDVTDYASGGGLTIVRKSDGTLWVAERPGVPSGWRQVATGF